jgi:hypothetical protein
LAAWLCGVAHKIAGKLRAAEARRRRRTAGEVPVPADRHPDPLALLTARELLDLLDEEVQRLPTAYRLPVLLCCMEGKTQDEAARQLGCTAGAIKGRLERGRARLQARLLRRGVTLSAAWALAETTRQTATAGLPLRRAEQISRAALAFRAGTAGNEASTAVRALARSFLSGHLLARGLTWLCLILCLGAAALAASALLQLPDEARTEAAAPPRPAPVDAAAARSALEKAWADLEQPEPTASRALLRLARAPRDVVPFLKEKLKPLKLDEGHLKALLAKLASDDKRVWKPAYDELETFDPRLAVDLEKLMNEVTKAPARPRLVALLSGYPADTYLEWGNNIELRRAGPDGYNFMYLGGSWWAEHKVARLAASHGSNGKPKWARAVRAIVLLEDIGTADAVAILRDLASGHPDAQPTRVARDTLDRLRVK